MSTILDALKKVEGQGGANPGASEPNELDRQIVHGGSTSIARPVRRGALVLLAISLAVFAGAGLTWLGMALLDDGDTGGTTPEVASAGPSGGDSGLVGVEVDGRVAEVVDGQRLGEPPAQTPEEVGESLEPEPATALLARAPDPDALTTPVVSATPPTDRETVVIPPPPGAQNQLDPAKKLAARRDTRFSRPARARPPAAGAVAGEASGEVAAPASVEPVEAARVAAPRPAPPMRSSERKGRSHPEPVAAVVEERAAAVDPSMVPPEAIVRPPVEIVDIARPKREAASAPPDEPRAKTLETLTRPALPKIGVTATLWHPQKSRRTAELRLLESGEARLLTVRQGDRAGPYEVAEISPTGVTLLHEGVEIQRRVGAEER